MKLATVMKNNVAPLQAAQAALIAKRVALINLRLTMYREQFKLKDVSVMLLLFKAILYSDLHICLITEGLPPYSDL